MTPFNRATFKDGHDDACTYHIGDVHGLTTTTVWSPQQHRSNCRYCCLLSSIPGRHHAPVPEQPSQLRLRFPCGPHPRAGVAIDGEEPWRRWRRRRHPVAGRRQSRRPWLWRPPHRPDLRLPSRRCHHHRRLFRRQGQGKVLSQERVLFMGSTQIGYFLRQGHFCPLTKKLTRL